MARDPFASSTLIFSNIHPYRVSTTLLNIQREKTSQWRYYLLTTTTNIDFIHTLTKLENQTPRTKMERVFLFFLSSHTNQHCLPTATYTKREGIIMAIVNLSTTTKPTSHTLENSKTRPENKNGEIFGFFNLLTQSLIHI